MAEINCSRCECRAFPVDTRTVRFAVTEPFGVEDLDVHDWAVCTTSDCPIYYFAVDEPERVITVDALRTTPAMKNPAADATFCFCFDASRSVVLGPEAFGAIAYISERVAARACACDVLNPAGACCLGSITAERKAAGLPLRAAAPD